MLGQNIKLDYTSSRNTTQIAAIRSARQGMAPQDRWRTKGSLPVHHMSIVILMALD
jgi:hypothetical protein